MPMLQEGGDCSIHAPVSLRLSEAPNGRIKEVMGFRRFSLRGVEKVQGEWHLVCLALNIKRMRGLAAC